MVECAIVLSHGEALSLNEAIKTRMNYIVQVWQWQWLNDASAYMQLAMWIHY